MNYLTTEDLEGLEFLLVARIDTLKDRAGTLHAFERAEFNVLRDIQARLILELHAATEKEMNQCQN